MGNSESGASGIALRGIIWTPLLIIVICSSCVDQAIGYVPDAALDAIVVDAWVVDARIDATTLPCEPGVNFCQGDSIWSCTNQGQPGTEIQACVAPVRCLYGECLHACTAAELQQTHVGCEFIATDMGNVDEYDANDSCFVVAVSNVEAVGVAVVTVEDDQGALLDFPGVGTQWNIDPGELAVIPITGNLNQCSLIPARPNTTTMTTGLMPGSAFRIHSTLPVVAYQINPYEAAEKHTTDAALLIPVATLGDQYIVASHEGLSSYDYSSAISIVAVNDNTVVSIAPSAAVAAGAQIVGGSAPFDITLNALEHLQLLASGQLDLINTTITATGPIAVYGGALCANVPAAMGFCDHIEEMMPSVNSWGQQYVAAVPPQRASENAYWRIITAVDQTHIAVLPYSQYDRVLNRGEVLEIDELGSFVVTATADTPDPMAEPRPIMVVNYLKGSEQTAADSDTDIETLGNLRGDPAMTLSVPVEQYLDSYLFLSDPSYAYNYVVIVRTDSSQPIHLDCWDPIPESAFTPISSGFSRALVTLGHETPGSTDGNCEGWGNVHSIWSAAPFGIWVYGYFADTSYGYPGGMNFRQINDLVIIAE